MKQCLERLYNGIIKENPTFVLMLGMCPTLAVTVSAINGFGMGISTMVVLAMSNLLISLLRKIIPDKVRIPIYIVVVATFVTIVELLMHAFVPSLYESLGIYISLIVVNCIILGRAEAYAAHSKPLPSLFDGIGMGLGFTFALTIIGLVREIIGTGKAFGVSLDSIFGSSLAQMAEGLVGRILPADSSSPVIQALGGFFAHEAGSISPILIFALAPGAFFVLAALTAIQNKIKMNLTAKGKDASKIQSGCNSDCMNCSDAGCSRRLIDEKIKEADDVSSNEDDAFEKAVVGHSDIDVIELDELEPEKPVKKSRAKKTTEAAEELAAEVTEQAVAPKQVDEEAKTKPVRKPRAKKEAVVTEAVAEVAEEVKEKPVRKPRAKKEAVVTETVAEVAEETKEEVKEKPVRKPRAKKEAVVSETVVEVAGETTEEVKEKPVRKPRAKKTTVKEENADE